MIEKQTVVDQIAVIENGTILYREATKVFEDGKEIARTYHRTTLVPGSDLSQTPGQVVDIANVTWTTEVIQKYKDSILNAQED